MNYANLYEHLGRLFYAVAAADGEVNEKETLTLKKEIEAIWLPLENSKDLYGSDAAHKIWMAFETSDEQSMDAKEAFEVFKNYYHHTQSDWTPDLKKKVQKTSAAVANAFDRYNKAELQILSALHLLMGGG